MAVYCSALLTVSASRTICFACAIHKNVLKNFNMLGVGWFIENTQWQGSSCHFRVLHYEDHFRSCQNAVWNRTFLLVQASRTLFSPNIWSTKVGLFIVYFFQWGIVMFMQCRNIVPTPFLTESNYMLMWMKM